MSLDNIMKKIKKENKNIHSCKVCGVLRRKAMNTAAKKLNLDVLVTGHNMDDESQTVLMNIFKGNRDIMQRQGITTSGQEGFVRRIKPLYFISEKEARLYCILKELDVDFDECPYSEESYRNDIKNMLNDFEVKYKGTKNAIINTYLYILPKIKLGNPSKKTKMGYCEDCQEPSQQEKCKACELVKEIGL